MKRGDCLIIKIDFESEVPIYEQLNNCIIRGIAKEELKEGEPLPSVRQMASDIGINMHTVNKSYNMLKAEGYISIDRRKGALVGGKKNEPHKEFLEAMLEKQENIIATAICNGVGKNQFIELCKKIYDAYDHREEPIHD